MRKLLPLFIFMLSVILCSTFAFASEPDMFAGGTGTESDPYLISDKTQLDNIRSDLDAHYKLIDDIVFEESDFEEEEIFYNNGSLWTPVGDADAPFTGTFDGDGHYIKGLQSHVKQSMSDKYGGLFGYSEGTIKNVGVVDGYIGCWAGEGDGYLYFGGIVGYGGYVENCYSSMTISNGHFSGGISGGGSIISNCFNTGYVNGVFAVGGIVGTAPYEISNCYNAGPVAVSPDIVTVKDEDKDKIGENIGGIAGNSDSESVLTDCVYLDIIERGVGDDGFECLKLNDAQMSSDADFDGFDFSEIWEQGTHSTYKYPVLQGVEYIHTTTEFAAGNGTWNNPYVIVGKQHLNNVRKHPDAYFLLLNDITFTEEDFSENGDFYNNGEFWTPIGDTDSPFKGNFDGAGHKICGLKININTSADAYAGLFGVIESGTVMNLGMRSYSIVVTGQSEAEEWNCLYAGSIAGLLNGGIIENCSAAGNVTISSVVSLNRAGGIVGGMDGDCEVRTSYNSGNVTADSTDNVSTAGGIAGDVNYGKITDCYNSGSVNASAANETYAFSGGIAGEISSLSGTSSSIGSCYNSGKVSVLSASARDLEQAKGTASGIVSSCLHSTVADCYSINTVSACVGSDDSPYENVSVLSADSMKDESSFVSFDFEETWKMGDGKDYLYPTLSNVPHESIGIVSIEISQPPHKTEYIENDELDLTGGKFTVKYSDGSEEIFDLSMAVCEGFDSTEAGEVVVTVTYMEQTASFTITVVHDYCESEIVSPSCTEGGYTEYICSQCNASKTGEITDPLGHTEDVVAGFEATCTESGLTDGCVCTECGEIIVEQEVIPSPGHAEEIVKGYDATCTTPGLTDGKNCSVCGETLEEQEEITASGHNEEEIPSKDATCTQDGSLGGMQCSVCNEVTSEPEIIKASGHEYSEPKPDGSGYFYVRYCDVCTEYEMLDPEETSEIINEKLEELTSGELSIEDEDLVNELLGVLVSAKTELIEKYDELMIMKNRFLLYHNGDIDFDGIIRSTDLSLFLFHYDQDTDASFDLTGDGIVNHLDLSTLLTNYGNRA